MNQQIIVISWSHHKIPLSVRDELSISRNEIQECIHLLLDKNQILELAVLSTCNRIEYYALAGNSVYVLTAIKNLYANLLKRNIPWHQAAPEIYVGIEAVQHLCRVAVGMESIILGENQILSQVKRVQHTLLKSQPGAEIINQLFNDTIKCAETIRNDIPISLGPSSISELAVITALKIYDDLKQRKVLIIGSGETADLTARYFIASGVNQVFISNRSEKRGRALAEAISGEFINLHHINDILYDCDVIVTATHARNYLISRDQIDNIMKRKKEKFLLLDLSTPRNIDPSAHDINNVCIYDLDHLDAISSINREKNQESLSNAEIIVKNYSRKWMEWFQLKDLKDKELELIEETD